MSIQPVISKVYERFFFYRRLYEYFSANNNLLSLQFDFRSRARTEHALLKFTDDILQCFDNTKIAIATFMDLSKAFDCENHDILLTKPRRYGVNLTPHRHHSQTNRQQRRQMITRLHQQQFTKKNPAENRQRKIYQSSLLKTGSSSSHP